MASQVSISDMYTPFKKYIEYMLTSLPDSKALRVFILDEETVWDFAPRAPAATILL